MVVEVGDNELEDEEVGAETLDSSDKTRARSPEERSTAVSPSTWVAVHPGIVTSIVGTLIVNQLLWEIKESDIMNATITMLPWTLLLFALPTLGDIDKTHGVAPSLIAYYVPSDNNNLWKCLDGNKEIPWAAVNDDYCDCADGSDEPGTSACPNSTFYCANSGHIGATIRSSRVNDGLCESECCDGSDEHPGVCPNVCREIGESYKQKLEEELKIRKTGAKIRSTYIAFAKKEKQRLEKLVATTSQEVVVREKEVDRLKAVLERAESVSATSLEHKKQSPLYGSLQAHSRALKALQTEHKKHLEREKALGDILEALKSGYNPNYQDMAVLEAVRGWEQLSNTEQITVDDDELGSDDDEDSSVVDSETEAEQTPEELDEEIKTLLKTDYVNLLLAHEQHMGSPSTDSILFDVSLYIPDFLAPKFGIIKDTLVSWLRMLGIVPAVVNTSTDTSQARTAYNDAEHSLKLTRKEKQDAQQELADLFDLDGYGRDGEWKKLTSLCLSKDTGDYTYEVCIFDEARQRPNKGGSSHSLGKFSAWNKDTGVNPGDPAYYSKQHYTGGAKCWNGPSRSVTLVLTCGIENAIHTVTEPEKCEYQFAGTSPALCLPLDSSSEGTREEL